MRVRIKHARLAEELTKRRLSQNAWAHRIGISPGHLSNLVCGRRPYPSTATQRKLLEALDVPFGDLFEIEPDQPEPEPAQAPLFSRALFGLRFKVEREPVPAFRARWTGFGRLGDFKLDVGYALRRFGLSPGFTAVAVLTLGIGLGANVAIFSVADKLLWKPLPYKEPERLYRVVGVGPNSRGYPHAADYLAFHRASLIVGAAESEVGSAILMSPDGARHVSSEKISPGFLGVLGVSPSLGRFFSDEDFVSGSQSIIVSFSFWRSQLGGDPEIVGKTIPLREGGIKRIVGVLPAGFVYPDTLNPPPEILLPFAEAVDERRSSDSPTYPFVRLRPGVERAAAEAEISAIVASTCQTLGEENPHTGARLRPLHESIFWAAQPASRLLVVAGGLLLLIACANVASLLLARGVMRREELAVRSALGARRWRLIRLLGTESAILGGAAGLAGLGLAYAALPALTSLLPGTRVRAFLATSYDMDGRVAVFCLVAAIAVALVVGLLPALRHSSARPSADARGAASAGRLRGEGFLVFGEVSLALTLLIGSLLLLASYRQLIGEELGYDTEKLVLLSATLPYGDRYDAHERTLFYSALVDQVRSFPEVEAVTAADVLPIGGAVADRTEVNGTRINVYAIHRDYFSTLGIQVELGRPFLAEEIRENRPVAIVTTALAKKLWPGVSPLGKRIPHDESEREVVGVVDDVRESLKRNVPVVFVPMGSWEHSWSIIARLRAESMVEKVRERLRDTVPMEATVWASPLSFLKQREAARERTVTFLMTAFATLSVLVTAVGLFGIVAYAVSRRTHEIGVRRALGATSREIRSLILRRAMIPVVLGLIAGAAAGSAASRLLEAWLWEISPGDPRPIGAAVALMLVIALVACLLPTRQAVRVDPREALQAE